MPITITRHAQQRAKQRGIDMLEVERVVHHPFSTDAGNNGAVVLYGPCRPDGRKLKIIVAGDDNECIISVMYADC